MRAGAHGDARRARRGAGRARAADPDEYELLIEAIYEGYLLHYGASRLLADADADLALLAGDRLYTLGLERLVALGDLEAVRELADVIALCALLVGRGEADACEPLWRAGAQRGRLGRRRELPGGEGAGPRRRRRRAGAALRALAAPQPVA